VNSELGVITRVKAVGDVKIASWLLISVEHAADQYKEQSIQWLNLTLSNHS
jgi:hypothetical protein